MGPQNENITLSKFLRQKFLLSPSPRGRLRAVVLEETQDRRSVRTGQGPHPPMNPPRSYAGLEIERAGFSMRQQR